MTTAKIDRRAVMRAVVTISVLTAAAAFALVANRAEGVPPPSAPPAASLTCSPADLGTLGGSQGNATAVSSNGLVTGYAEDRSGTPQPVLWKSGKARRIVTGLLNVAPTGINRRGEVVGVGVEPSDLETVGWHWVGGKTTLLRAPAGKVAMPEAINDAGRIAGALASNDDGEGAAPARGRCRWARIRAEPEGGHGRQLPGAGPLHADHVGCGRPRDWTRGTRRGLGSGPCRRRHGGRRRSSRCCHRRSAGGAVGCQPSREEAQLGGRYGRTGQRIDPRERRWAGRCARKG